MEITFGCEFALEDGVRFSYPTDRGNLWFKVGQSRPLWAEANERLFYYEPAILEALFYCMLKKEKLIVRYGGADEVFLENMRLYQKRLLAPVIGWNENWTPIANGIKERLSEIEILCEPRKILGSTEKRRVGLFFSGGVDSTYTLLFNPTVTDIIIVKMIETNVFVSESIAKTIRPDAKIHIVESSLFKSLMLSWPGWGHVTSGSHLYAIGHTFQDILGTIIVSEAYRHEGQECATGHDVDYLASSSRLRFQTFGFAERPEKVKALLEHPRANEFMFKLQVCYRAKPPGFVNCSSCPKCLETMKIIDTLGGRKLARGFNWNKFEERYEKEKKTNTLMFY